MCGKSKHAAGKAMQGSRGFTLVASLLLLTLLSAIAVGLMYTVNGSGRVGGNDLESNIAFYGAESGMEKLTSDVLSLYQQKLAPSQTDLTNLAKTSPPSSAQIPGITYLESATWTNVDGNGNPITTTNIVSQGPYAGLTAEIIPMTLQVSAIRTSGAAVNMTRGIEIAMIPVFQFGVFSDSDLAYFAGPPFAFLGRVHTNGNLFLNADSGPLVLGDKVTAAGQILRDRLPNNHTAGTGGYFGDVYLATSSGGCNAFAAVVQNNSGAKPATGAPCVNWGKDTDNSTDDSSWSGGIPLSATPGAANGNWSTIAKNTLNQQAVTGAPTLTMPFVQGANINSADSQIEIIRKQETTGESPASPIGASREYNKANIRILLGDNEAELHPNGTANDGNDVQLETLLAGVTVTGVGGKSYFAVADQVASQDPNLIPPRCKPGANAAAPYPTYPETSCVGGTTSPWPLVRGWLRVEYLDKASGTWIGITNEWLGYGFAKSGLIPRITPGADTKGHPNALLIFQQLADRNGDGTISGAGANTKVYNGGGTYEGYENTSISGSGVNFYPINFFDPREGFPRDTLPTGRASTSTMCYVNGILNAVELDTGNLAKWLTGTAPYNAGSGKKVNSGPQNGYLVYFSDRRGMMPNPNETPANVTNGESGLEDTINSGSATGTPDGNLEAATAGYNNNNGFSPEDVDENGILDNWGAVNIGDGFGLNTNTAPPNSYAAVDCFNQGRQNWVSGARHVLRLIDGSLGNLPMPGFTVASENPVYIWGDYNSKSSDTIWQNPPVDTAQNAAAAVIADAVTLLSNDWTDLNDMKNPNNLNGRQPVNDTSFRVAIAAGKNMNFPNITAAADFGTDGGVHNFLRYIENMGNINLNYRGSLISLYYSEYATGIFKCCSLVYSPPNRNYSFDTDFLVPTNLPPGTPMMQDIDTLSYWQNFSPCTTQSNGSCTN